MVSLTGHKITRLLFIVHRAINIEVGQRKVSGVLVYCVYSKFFKIAAFVSSTDPDLNENSEGPLRHVAYKLRSTHAFYQLVFSYFIYMPPRETLKFRFLETLNNKIENIMAFKIYRAPPFWIL